MDVSPCHSKIRTNGHHPTQKPDLRSSFITPFMITHTHTHTPTHIYKHWLIQSFTHADIHKAITAVSAQSDNLSYLSVFKPSGYHLCTQPLANVTNTRVDTHKCTTTHTHIHASNTQALFRKWGPIRCNKWQISKKHFKKFNALIFFFQIDFFSTNFSPPPPPTSLSFSISQGDLWALQRLTEQKRLLWRY